MAIANLQDQEAPFEGESATSSELNVRCDEKADSLASGVIFLLAITVLQKMVGFVRSIAFCGMMEDSQLGRWSLSYSFLLMIAPLAMLGIPGSFGRYYEFYRQRNQHRTFLRRTTRVCFLLAALVVFAVMCFPGWFSWLAFGEASQTGLIRLLGITLAIVIVFNYQTELLTAMRRVRVVSLMQLTNSLVFAVAGLALVWFAERKELAVIGAFGLAALCASIVAAVPLIRGWSGLPKATTVVPQSDFWAKLLPLAGWLWLSDALFNLFDAADRFMIVHFANEANAEAIVGQYHSSRVIPILLVAIAAMLSGVLLPYLSHDWESGRQKLVSRRLSLALKLVGVGFSVVAGMILLCSPLLFGWLLGGRYDDGLQVLPGTLVYCVWFGLIMIVQTFLMCAERAGWGSFALFVGLLLNVALNRVCLPYWGLPGAVFATAAANGLALAVAFWFAQRNGLRVDWGIGLVAILPLTLLLSAWLTFAAVLALVFAMSRNDSLLDRPQREMLTTALLSYWHKLRRRNQPLSENAEAP